MLLANIFCEDPKQTPNYFQFCLCHCVYMFSFQDDGECTQLVSLENLLALQIA